MLEHDNTATRSGMNAPAAWQNAGAKRQRGVVTVLALLVAAGAGVVAGNDWLFAIAGSVAMGAGLSWFDVSTNEEPNTTWPVVGLVSAVFAATVLAVVVTDEMMAGMIVSLSGMLLFQMTSVGESSVVQT